MLSLRFIKEDGTTNGRCRPFVVCSGCAIELFFKRFFSAIQIHAQVVACAVGFHGRLIETVLVGHKQNQRNQYRFGFFGADFLGADMPLLMHIGYFGKRYLLQSGQVGFHVAVAADLYGRRLAPFAFVNLVFVVVDIFRFVRVLYVQDDAVIVEGNVLEQFQRLAFKLGQSFELVFDFLQGGGIATVVALNHGLFAGRSRGAGFGNGGYR